MNPPTNNQRPPGQMPDIRGARITGRQGRTWIVGEPDDRKPGETGRNFCVCHLVTEEGKPDQQYFLKCLDFYRRLELVSSDPIRDMQPLLNAYAFEQLMLEKCAGGQRVVIAVDDGQFVPAGERLIIPFLVFEKGEGDLNRHLGNNHVTFSWKIRTLHNIAAAIQFVHARDIAHQDLKPSNTIVFPAVTKIADLGRASHKTEKSPFDELDFPGDPFYKPPEFSYGWSDPDFERRRFGADVYMLGAIGIFLFTGLHLNTIALQHLPGEYKPQSWNGTYEQVLPYYENAYHRGLEDVKAALPDNKVAEELLTVLRWMCEPDPMKRGYSNFGHVAPTAYSINKVISKLNVLVGEADMLAYRDKGAAS